MPLLIVRNDITKMEVDAIVNAANSSLLGGGGVDGAIHKAAGPKLLEECRLLNGCETGDAKITGAGDLPCRYVIHTVGPVWEGGGSGEEGLLRSCYTRSLELAAKYECVSVAFPLISSGIYGYPKDQALKVAVDVISSYLLEGHELTVYIVVFDKKAYKIGEKLFDNISEYIDDHYAEIAEKEERRRGNISYSHSIAPPQSFMGMSMPSILNRKSEKEDRLDVVEECACEPSLDDMIKMIDESFSQMLLRKIDESGMTDAECYKKANIDRKLFSKIRSDINYKPSKPTVIAFAIALRLNMKDTRELLMKAGFALSDSNKFDIIIRYFIEHGNYDVFEINEALFAFDQQLLA
ncbi:MAG: O-acetyl-ADP-ribose deacetylase [Clostridiales bacterium]|nr:O-acetyl-ADP-ribose deacetylase [Clostridiales bacterium]